MELYGLALYHPRLECLDTKPVKGRCTVKKDRMTFHHVLKDIPYDRILTVYYLLCRLHSLDYSPLNKFPYDKRFVEFCSHELRKTAFVHLKFRTYNDHRTCRIVNTLSEKVLTETTLLTFKAIRQGFKSPVGLTLDCT